MNTYINNLTIYTLMSSSLTHIVDQFEHVPLKDIDGFPSKTRMGLFIEQVITTLPQTQNEIAQKTGTTHPNLIHMKKNGVVDTPITRRLVKYLQKQNSSCGLELLLTYKKSKKPIK
mgnify:FL=1